MGGGVGAGEGAAAGALGGACATGAGIVGAGDTGGSTIGAKTDSGTLGRFTGMLRGGLAAVATCPVEINDLLPS